MGGDGGAAFGAEWQRGQKSLLLSVEEGAEEVEPGDCWAGEAGVEGGETERAVPYRGGGWVEI